MNFLYPVKRPRRRLLTWVGIFWISYAMFFVISAVSIARWVFA